MVLLDVILRGTRGLQPAANTVAEGSLYFVTDEGLTEQSVASAWVSYSSTTIPSTTANYVVSTTTTTLPNSHVLTAGAGIVITNTTGLSTIRNSATTSSYIVSTTSTTSLPNSLVLTAGTGITLTTTLGTIVIAGTVTQGASTTAPYLVSTTTTTLPNSVILIAGSNVTFTTSTTSITINAAASGGGASTTASYIVSTTEAGLPNSLRLIAGNNVTFTTSTTSVTVNSTASGGSSGWTFITTAAASGATVDFTTGLSTFSEIMVVMQDVTVSGGGIRQLLVTTNGTTFLNTSGNYFTIDTNGATTNGTVVSFDNGNNGTAHSGWIVISLFNNTNSIKPAWTGFGGTNCVGFVNTTTALTGVRTRPHAGTFNGGNFFVYGR